MFTYSPLLKIYKCETFKYLRVDLLYVKTGWAAKGYFNENETKPDAT